jgi:predicted dehydrogenase
MAREQQGQPATEAGAALRARRIRVGLVGCGEVTQIVHWPSLYHLADRYEVTALCDVSSTVLRELGTLWNVRNLTTDYRQLVARTDVDAVLIANPNAFHAEVTLAAIAAGKHILVEKPMCITRREAEQIMAAQNDRGVVVQVGYMRRYAPAFLDACDAVRQMGGIKYARVRAFIGSNALIVNPTSRVIREAAMPEARRKEAKAREDALLDEALGGKPTEALKQAYSLMLGLSSHDLSAMRELLGMPDKVLFAARRGSANVEGGIGIYLAAAFDYGAYVCQFETGIDRIPRFDARLEVYGGDRVIRVQYDTPYVRNLPIRLLVTESNGRGGVKRQDSHPVWGDPFVAEWKAFHENVTENRAPKTGPADFAQDLELFAEIARLMREP